MAHNCNAYKYCIGKVSKTDCHKDLHSISYLSEGTASLTVLMHIRVIDRVVVGFFRGNHVGSHYEYHGYKFKIFKDWQKVEASFLFQGWALLVIFTRF